MFLLPFIRILDKMPGLHQIWLFLERNGSHLIDCEQNTVEEAIEYATEFAHVNNLSLDGEPFCINTIVFCPIKKDSSELSNFYTSMETPLGTSPSREVWRSFLWASTIDNLDSWGINRLLDSLPLSEKDTVYSVISGIMNGP